jgi:hypothetical protein
MPDTNSRYKQLGSESIHKFESKRRALEENLRADSARVSSRQREVQESLRAAGFDVSKLESLLLRDKEDLPRRLEQILPPLVNREKSTDGHNIKDTFSKIDVAGKAMLVPVAATLMSNNADFLRGNPVLERGNPWITSATPQILKIKVSVSGYPDWGCPNALGGPTIGPAESLAQAFFGFAPATSGVWNFMAVANLSGFYVLIADDEWYNCKSSHVILKMGMGVYQYFWQGLSWETLIDQNHENVNGGFPYTSTEYPYCQAFLRAGDWTDITLGFDLWCKAQGAGSYADLDFSDGAANFIEPLVVFAWPN